MVAAAATFLSQHYGAPVMLFALLLGLAMNFLSADDGPCAAGIAFSARTLLRVGVALLGLRITGAQVVALGWQPALMVVLSVVLTIAAAMLAARALGFQPLFGLLTGAATAICGASAALALAAALPAHPQKERATLFTVIGISALITCLIGGMDSLRGVIVAGFIIAAAENLTALYIDPRYVLLVPVLILLVVLAVRPWGLFGTVEEFKRV